MYVNIWSWMRDFEIAASQQNDTQRLQLVRGYDRAWSYVRTGRYDEALSHFEQILALALKLNEPCWELFLDSNCCELFMYYKAEIQMALDRTMRLATRAYKPIYQTCPVRSRIYCNLADIYSDVDWFSYLDEIFDLLNYIENEVDMDEDTHLRVKYIRAHLYCDLERYDDAEAVTQACLAQGFTNPYRMSHGNEIMMRITYARGDLVDALAHAQERERYARMPSILRSIANALLWQAVITYRLDEKGKAQELLQRGLAEYQRYNLPLRSAYYATLSEYYELGGDYEKAQSLLEQHITEAQSQTMTAQCISHLNYCRLLGRLGKPLTKALAAARAITPQMKKPDLYLERVQKIEDGQHYLYAWQKV